MAPLWTGKTVNELLAEMDSADFKDFAIDGLIARSVTTILGDPYLGKTHLTLDIARSLLTGEPLLGRKVLHQVSRLAFLCTDPGGQYDIAKRLKREARIFGDRVLAMSFYTPESFEDWSAYTQIFERESIDAIVIDNTSDLAEDTNSPKEVKAVTDGLRKWSDSGTVVMNIHHRNKGGGYFGSMLWQKWTRAELELTGDKRTPNRKLKFTSNNSEPLDMSLRFNPEHSPAFALTKVVQVGELEAEAARERASRDQETMNKNRRVTEAINRGEPYASIAQREGISKSRVTQIKKMKITL